MVEKILAVFVQTCLLAITDGRKALIRAHRRRHVRRDASACRGVATFQADDDEPRGDTITQLVDQQSLRWSWGLREEGREICGVARASYDHDGHADSGHPNEAAHEPRARHFPTSGPMVSSERSPSASRISTSRMVSRAPLM